MEVYDQALRVYTPQIFWNDASAALSVPNDSRHLIYSGGPSSFSSLSRITYLLTAFLEDL